MFNIAHDKRLLFHSNLHHNTSHDPYSFFIDMNHKKQIKSDIVFLSGYKDIMLSHLHK